MRTAALEVLYGGLDVAADVSQQARSRLQRVVSLLADEIVAPGDVAAMDKESDNTILFLSGSHGGLTVTKPRTRIIGQPGATFERLVTVDADDVVFVGCSFQSVAGSNNEGQAVLVTSDAKCSFVDCRFRKPDTMAGDFVTVQNGGKAHFVLPRFGPANSSGGNCVNNAGAALDVNLIGLVNSTGLANVNVTVFGQYT
jgi:hypothetical protein